MAQVADIEVRMIVVSEEVLRAIIDEQFTRLVRRFQYIEQRLITLETKVDMLMSKTTDNYRSLLAIAQMIASNHAIEAASVADLVKKVDDEYNALQQVIAAGNEPDTTDFDAAMASLKATSDKMQQTAADAAAELSKVGGGVTTDAGNPTTGTTTTDPATAPRSAPDDTGTGMAGDSTADNGSATTTNGDQQPAGSTGDSSNTAS